MFFIVLLLVCAVAGWVSATWLFDFFENRALLGVVGVVSIVGVVLRVLGELKIGIFGDAASNFGVALLFIGVFFLAGSVRVIRGV